MGMNPLIVPKSLTEEEGWAVLTEFRANGRLGLPSRIALVATSRFILFNLVVDEPSDEAGAGTDSSAQTYISSYSAQDCASGCSAAVRAQGSVLSW